MAALTNERNTQKLRFFDWLISEINSGAYEGLHWVDENRTVFRIPWKHNSRKNLVENDYRIFKAWAVVSKKYNESVKDPAKWKTNFRNALKSTKRFKEVESKDSDYHMYQIIQPDTSVTANHSPDAGNRSDCENGWLQVHERPPAFQHYPLLQQQDLDVSLKNLSLENPVSVATEGTAQNFYQCNGDLLHCAMQEANLGEIQRVCWPPVSAGGAAYVPDACTVPQINQNNDLSLANVVAGIPVANNYYEVSRWLAENMPETASQSADILRHAQQNSPPGQNQVNNVGEVLCNVNHVIENVFMDEEPQGNGFANTVTRDDCHLLTVQHTMMEQEMLTQPLITSTAEQPPLTTVASQNYGDPLNLAVSIYYRGRRLLETNVEMSSCIFTYQNHYQVSGNPQIIQFPSPEVLPDLKQVKHTLTVLAHAGLLLYEKNKKIYARRLHRCKVFWAFSKELDNVAENHMIRMLPRDVDIEIFNYERFIQELKIFHDNRKGPSPDYTIYLCFGQSFPSAKPKESKLILVKLVPQFCKQYHEQVQRHGASSLNSESLGLQISDNLRDLLDGLWNTCSM